MEWFKNLILKIVLKLNNNNKTIGSNKNQKNGISIIDNTINKQITNNTTIIMKATEHIIPNPDNIKNLSEKEVIEEFIEQGIKSSEEVAIFVKDNLKYFTNTANNRERQELLETINILKIITYEEKRVLIWTCILGIIPCANNFSIFKHHKKEIISKYPFIWEVDTNWIFEHLSIYNIHPDGNINRAIWSDKIKFEKLMNNKNNLLINSFDNIEELYNQWPEILNIFNISKKSGNYNLSYIIPFLNNSIKKAIESIIYLELKILISFD